MNTTILRKNWHYIVIGVLAVGLIATIVWAAIANDRANELQRRGTGGTSQTVDPRTALEDHGITPLTATEASNDVNTASELAYLIEEEKLAHDVYQTLYDKWGSRVFSNIMNSETAHQNLVLAVMESRGLTDPRKDEIGVFVNKDLQVFYDKLIAQGLQSQTEAYKAGVTIEETDIADLKETIAALKEQDTDVKDVLEMLLNGSENHLRAFSRQVSR